MLTRLQKWLLVAFLAACFVGACFGEWSSAKHPPKPNEINTSNTQHPSNTINNNSSAFFALGAWARDNHDAIEAIAALVSAFFAIVLTGSTTGLWIVTRTAANSAKAAAEALPILERAYLFFDEVTDIGFEFVPVVLSTDMFGDSTYGPDICVPKGGGLAFNVVNRGKTPAVITEVMGKSGFLPKFGTDLPPPIDILTEHGNKAPPHVSVSTTLGLHCFPNFATPLMGDARNGEQRLFVLGYVRYTDIFRKRHRIGFCLQYEPSVPTFGLIGGGEYNYTVDED